MKRTPLKRKAGIKTRRPVRTPEETDARAKVSARSGGWCELRIEGVCLGRATNYAHRRAEGQGGPYAASNGMDLCGMGNVSGCHGYAHQNPAEADENGWVVLSHEDWRTKQVRLYFGFTYLDDRGGFDPPDLHTAGCAVWTSDNPCDCEERS